MREPARVKAISTASAVVIAKAAAAAMIVLAALPSVALAEGPQALPNAVPSSTRAREDSVRKKLGETAEWRRLLHAHPTAGRGLEGEADGAAFYLSPRGKFDPVAELDATVEAFYASPGLGDEHALCKFPARRRFVETYVELAELPSPSCPLREAFYARIRPKKVLFVFSAYHVESPASAFGHVLVRVERDDAGLVRKDAPRHALADLGIDYSADVGHENAVTYALKGLFGQFPGTFKAMPYAAKVHEYQDYESRDLWEYELSFDESERRTFVEHLWELGGTSFDYFYLSENCAYHVLALFDVVRPSAHLLDGLKSPVLPADALRSVWEAPGLVSHVAYRPSLRTTTEARLRGLSSEARDLARTLAHDDDAKLDALAALATNVRAEVLDAALDLLDLEHPELLTDDSDTPARRRKYRLSVLRAKVPGESPELSIAPPEDGAPHLAHGTRRVALGTGYAGGSNGPGRAFFTARARLSLHDMLDGHAGLPELASLEVLETELRLYPERREVELEKLSAVHVEKLAPWSLVEHGASYRFLLGGERLRDDGCSPDCFVFRVDGGAGLAARPEAHTVLFARADTSFVAGSELRGLDDRAFRFELGPTAGVRLALTPSFTMIGEGKLAWLPGAATPYTAQASAEARFAFSRYVATGLSVRRQLRAADVGITAFVYF